MKVEGEEAGRYIAVSLSSYANVNLGVLTYADEDDGQVKWKDKTGEIRSVTLGPHQIRIRRK
jgi:hypothetical protein